MLAKYPDPRNNPDFNNVYAGWESANRYADGFFALPDKNSVEIKIGELSNVVAVGEMQFVIYDEGGAVNVTNSNNEIVFSNAAGPSNDTYIVNGETNACIQGGDNESEFFSSYFEGMRTQPQIHLTWGKFNYRQRKPGERMLPSGDEVPSPYGFPVEFRIR